MPSNPTANESPIECPFCDWESRPADTGSEAERLSREVDAELHYESNHLGEELPSDAGFGEYQCSKCQRMDGLQGTASCKRCGFIPEGDRA